LPINIPIKKFTDELQTKHYTALIHVNISDYSTVSKCYDNCWHMKNSSQSVPDTLADTDYIDW